jgi:hypothetical protein
VMEYLGLSMTHDQVFNASIDGKEPMRVLLSACQKRRALVQQAPKVAGAARRVPIIVHCHDWVVLMCKFTVRVQERSIDVRNIEALVIVSRGVSGLHMIM